jgi:predicted O-methyltransferase YrrM
MSIINAPLDKCSGYGLIELLKNKKNIKGLEIGCAEGTTTEFLLKELPQLTLWGVDPYEDYIDWNGNSLDKLNEKFISTMNRLKPYTDRFKLIRKYSDDAVNDFENESLDFIFIDGLHTHDQVKKDLENFYPKLKKDGLFSGHDFFNIQEVREAVREFAIRKNLKTIQSTDFDVWYWWKD